MRAGEKWRGRDLDGAENGRRRRLRAADNRASLSVPARATVRDSRLPVDGRHRLSLEIDFIRVHEQFRSWKLERGEEKGTKEKENC